MAKNWRNSGFWAKFWTKFALYDERKMAFWPQNIWSLIIIIIINVVVSALSTAVRPIVHYSVWVISENKHVFRALRKAGVE